MPTPSLAKTTGPSMRFRQCSTAVLGFGVLVFGAAAWAQDAPSTAPATPAAPVLAVTAPDAATAVDAVSAAVPVTPSDGAAAAGVVASAAGAKPPGHMRGAIAFRNLTGVTALTPDYEQSYLPYEGLGILMTPRWQLNETMSIGLWQYATVELSNTGNTKYYREPQLSDTSLSFGWTVLNATGGNKTAVKSQDGLNINVQAMLGLPTSKASLAKQLYASTGIGVSTRLVFHGLTASLITRGIHNSYKSTTMQYDAPWLHNCTGTSQGCEPFQSTGVRSGEWRMLLIGSLAYAITERLGASVSAGEIMDWLPPLQPAQIATTGTTGLTRIQPSPDASNFRALMYWGVGTEFAILDWLSAGVGLETYNAQLKANSTYETAFVNRYTTMYVELSVGLDVIPL